MHSVTYHRHLNECLRVTELKVNFTSGWDFLLFTLLCTVEIFVSLSLSLFYTYKANHSSIQTSILPPTYPTTHPFNKTFNYLLNNVSIRISFHLLPLLFLSTLLIFNSIHIPTVYVCIDLSMTKDCPDGVRDAYNQINNTAWRVICKIIMISIKIFSLK